MLIRLVAGLLLHSPAVPAGSAVWMSMSSKPFSAFAWLEKLASEMPVPAAPEPVPAPVAQPEPAQPARAYDVRHMAGKCANGAHRDAGPLYHAVDRDGTALCGRRPRIQWSDHREDRTVTCTKCLAKVRKAK